MNDLSHVGLHVRAVNAPKGQTRFEVRTGNSSAHIALFHKTVRMSDGVPVVNVSTQFVRRKELTEEQVSAVEEWQKEHVFVALSKSTP